MTHVDQVGQIMRLVDLWKAISWSTARRGTGMSLNLITVVHRADRISQKHLVGRYGNLFTHGSSLHERVGALEELPSCHVHYPRSKHRRSECLRTAY